MIEVDGEVLRGEFFPQMAGHGFGGIDGAMLSACAAECHLQVSESAGNIALGSGVDQGITVREEGENLAVIFKELNYGLVAPVELLIGLISPGIMYGAAVKDESATIA